MIKNKLILLTGATGYIGGRLLQELEKKGLKIRCLARRHKVLASRLDSDTEVFKGDVLDKDSLIPIMDGVKVAFYLVHSMGSKGSFEQMDRDAARNFIEIAQKSGVELIIYLGGLCNEKETLSSISIGILWTLLLLSSTLSLRKFYQEDFENGSLIVIHMGGLSYELIVILKILSHFIFVQLPFFRTYSCNNIRRRKCSIKKQTINGSNRSY